jgi:hypothetical protein
MDAETLASPGLYPIAFDATADRVRLVALDETRYRAASFLDERLLPEVGPGEWVSRIDLRQAMTFAGDECDFIFHIGHVGSTLLSRLLGDDDRVFALREPAILRTLAAAELTLEDPTTVTDHTRMFLKLFARVYRSSQKTLLKATSFVSEIAPIMMTLNPSASAILMFVSPSVYVTAILSGEASRAELEITAPMRLARLHRRLGGQYWRLDDLSEGERAAMGWTCEIVALTQLADGYPGRTLWLDFDAFLARPEASLSATLRRLHGDAPQARVDAMLHSPHLSRYSKAPEHAFDSDLRRRVLAQAGRDYSLEIARGMAWLNAAGGRHAAIADAVRRIASAARAQ